VRELRLLEGQGATDAVREAQERLMASFGMLILLLLAILAAASAPSWLPVVLDVVGHWERSK
jgi:hypothetical protein